MRSFEDGISIYFPIKTHDDILYDLKKGDKLKVTSVENGIDGFGIRLADYGGNNNTWHDYSTISLVK